MLKKFKVGQRFLIRGSLNTGPVTDAPSGGEIIRFIDRLAAFERIIGAPIITVNSPALDAVMKPSVTLKANPEGYSTIHKNPFHEVIRVTEW